MLWTFCVTPHDELVHFVPKAWVTFGVPMPLISIRSDCGKSLRWLESPTEVAAWSDEPGSLGDGSEPFILPRAHIIIITNPSCYWFFLEKVQLCIWTGAWKSRPETCSVTEDVFLPPIKVCPPAKTTCHVTQVLTVYTQVYIPFPQMLWMHKELW